MLTRTQTLKAFKFTHWNKREVQASNIVSQYIASLSLTSSAFLSTLLLVKKIKLKNRKWFEKSWYCFMWKICTTIFCGEKPSGKYFTNSYIHWWTSKDIFFFKTAFQNALQHVSTLPKEKGPYSLSIFKCGGRFSLGFCFVLHLVVGILLETHFFWLLNLWISLYVCIWVCVYTYIHIYISKLQN